MREQPSCRITALAFLVLVFSGLVCAQSPVMIQVDAGRSLGPLPPIWNYFGYDEPNYTYAPHGRELIAELSASNRSRVQIRTHNLLTTGDGIPALKWGSTNAYTEDAAGHPIYDWKIIDKIFDTYLNSGAVPFVEIGFMPEALSTHPEPYRHHFPSGELFVGGLIRPTTMHKWRELAYQLTLHCIARYGRDEVFPGIGKFGMNRTSRTGMGLRKSMTSSTTTRSMVSGGPCRRRRLEVRRRLGRRPEGSRIPEAISRALRFRNELCQRKDWGSNRFHQLPCQGHTRTEGRACANGISARTPRMWMRG